MAVAAASAIAALARERGLSAGRIVPDVDDPCLAPAVAEATASRAVFEGLARRPLAPGEAAMLTRKGIAGNPTRE
jgi:malic enzyme